MFSTRGGEVVTHLPHTQKNAGANPASASFTSKQWSVI